MHQTDSEFRVCLSDFLKLERVWLSCVIQSNRTCAFAGASASLALTVPRPPSSCRAPMITHRCYNAHSRVQIPSSGSLRFLKLERVWLSCVIQCYVELTGAHPLGVLSYTRVYTLFNGAAVQPAYMCSEQCGPHCAVHVSASLHRRAQSPQTRRRAQTRRTEAAETRVI